MPDPLASDRDSLHSTAASSNDVYDDAISHADAESFATPTAESRPETPRQHLEDEATPRRAPAPAPAPAPVPAPDGLRTPAVQSVVDSEATLEGTPTPKRTLTQLRAESRETTSEEDEKEATREAEHTSSQTPSSKSSREGITAAALVEHPAPASINAAESVARVRSKESAVDEKHTENEDLSREDDTNYLSGAKLYLLTLGLFFATFVIALDNTIIATAIPKITTEFDSINDVGWYGSSYLLTTTSLQPSFGKIYTYFNVKWTYIIALVIFEAGSVVCATAPNSVALIVGRAIAGVGAAALFSGGMTIVGFSVPLRRRALYIAILSSTFGIASIIGPILGGIFTDSPTLKWRFCFWINLPVGGIAVVTTFFFFSSPVRKSSNLTFRQKIGKMDLPGAGVLICAIVCLLLALQWGGTTYPWHDSRVWGCLLGFGLLISLFIGLQLWIGENATIPKRIISQRAVAIGVTFTVFLSMALFSHIFYLPFYFQAVKGTSAEGSGIRTIPYLVSNTLMSIAVGATVTIFGPYTPFLWIGSAVFTVGAGMLYRLAVDDGAARWIGYQLIAGLGAGACIQIPFISVQTVLAPADMPTGNALTIFFNTLGGALSVSISQNIFSNELLQGLTRALPPAVVPIVANAGATSVVAATPPQYLAAVLQAFDDAVTRAFIVSIAAGGIAFVVSLFMPWGTVKGKNLLMGGA